jgi:DNA-binding LacI/PurR family transcriptional regulator
MRTPPRVTGVALASACGVDRATVYAWLAKPDLDPETRSGVEAALTQLKERPPKIANRLVARVSVPIQGVVVPVSPEALEGLALELENVANRALGIAQRLRAAQRIQDVSLGPTSQAGGQ